MDVVVKFNNERLDGKGLIAVVDTTEEGYGMFEILDNARLVDATGEIRVNGKVAEGSLFDMDMKQEEVFLTYGDIPRKLAKSDKVRIEVNIYCEEL